MTRMKCTLDIPVSVQSYRSNEGLDDAPDEKVTVTILSVHKVLPDATS